MPAHPDLIAQNAQFTKKLHQLSPTVFTAVGYAASNVHFLVGETGVVLIDTTETTQAAENILADFRQVSDLPITTIIYTHSHRDHISGATVFAEGRDVEVIAADNFSSDLVGVDNARPAPNAALMARTKRHFGISLTSDERISVGVGPGDRPMKGIGAGYIEPTVRIGETTRLTREGFGLELAKAPGETPDHLIVWWEAGHILFSGDNFYHAFPNLYAIRGTPYRDFDAWADTMDQLMAYAPAGACGPDRQRANAKLLPAVRPGDRRTRLTGPATPPVRGCGRCTGTKRGADVDSQRQHLRRTHPHGRTWQRPHFRQRHAAILQGIQCRRGHHHRAR
jgi:alkyl sulfatase BDS1-like metallo-beta-lactamase superfamily hydrolase